MAESANTTKAAGAGDPDSLPNCMQDAVPPSLFVCERYEWLRSVYDEMPAGARRERIRHILKTEFAIFRQQKVARCGRIRARELFGLAVRGPQQLLSDSSASRRLAIVGDISNGTYGVVHVAVEQEDVERVQEVVAAGGSEDDVVRQCGHHVEAYAIKCFRIYGSQRDMLIDRTILREISALRELNHPNILPILAIHVKQIADRPDGSHSNSLLSLEFPYADQDLASLLRKGLRSQEAGVLTDRTHPGPAESPLPSGSSLASPAGILKRYRPLPSNVIRAIMFQLLSGVRHMHEHSIVHRDIKPGNILVFTQSPQAGVIKIADFGLSRFIGASLDDFHKDGNVCTPCYRAPELMLGATAYTTAVDMWSVGCVFAELLTGSAIMRPRARVRSTASQAPVPTTRWNMCCWRQSEPPADPSSLPVQKKLSDESRDATTKAQIDRLFQVAGRPREDQWPDGKTLPLWGLVPVVSPSGTLKEVVHFTELNNCHPHAFQLLEALLTVNPAGRPTASEALQHEYFKENPSKYDNIFYSLERSGEAHVGRRTLFPPSHQRPPI